MSPDSTPVIEGPFPSPESSDPVDSSAARPGGDAVILHLTGPHRGSRQHLTDVQALIGTARDAVVHFPAGADPAVAGRHAVLVRGEDGWSVLEVEGQVYLNSADVPGLQGRETLVPGDILEIGTGGPVIRFVMEARNPPPYKSLKEAWRDCADCARHGRGGRVRRLALFFGSLPREMLTRTAPRTRVVVGGALAVLLVTGGALLAYGLRLERRIDAEEARSARVAEALASLAILAEGDPEARALVAELQDALTGRIEALEQLSDAGRRVVMAASSSVIFVQGGYQLVESESGLPLRVLLGPSGAPRVGPGGIPLTTTEGDGPVFEVQFTGSAWLASDDGLLVTNRHVAIPWSENEQIGPIFERGFEPRLRLIGYLPDQAEPVELEFVAASREVDLAVVRSLEMAGREPLRLADENPGPGQAILVLGYPAGIDALLARSGAVFVDSLMQRRPDFWSVVKELSEAGFIRPLATRGIVGQVTPSTVAYDAETTRGGSGGPVLSLDGEVVAVTFAILAEFGGSNLGVPAREVSRLLAEAAELNVRDEP
ncbi:MAG: trypsin-like peptidase domain-containing protein [Gemmatimonadetes bacterium]|nr:trypsin-like peptidase domain-containing protein [Gemmatimonadota bacterium]